MKLAEGEENEEGMDDASEREKGRGDMQSLSEAEDTKDSDPLTLE